MKDTESSDRKLPLGFEHETARSIRSIGTQDNSYTEPHYRIEDLSTM